MFPGDVLYAVKCNPEPAVLRAVYAGGVIDDRPAYHAPDALTLRALLASQYRQIRRETATDAIQSKSHAIVSIQALLLRSVPSLLSCLR